MKDTSVITETIKVMSGHEIPNSGHFDEELDLLKNLFPKHTHRVYMHCQPSNIMPDVIRPYVFETYQRWHVEGDFLITYYREDHCVSRRAHRIPEDVVAITEELI